MNFILLQDALRRELRRRIDAGNLTGLELARRTGFTQAHISNFLNRKRGLKLSALDRVLKSVGLSLYDLLNPRDLARFAAVPQCADADFADVPLVSAADAAAREIIANADVRELVKCRRALLARLRPDLAAPSRKSWTRFVWIHLDRAEAISLWPGLPSGATLLLDRHYNSLRPYRKNGRNLYAVRSPAACLVRYAELAPPQPASLGRNLILRPENLDSPVIVLPIPDGNSAEDLLVGRVTHVSFET